MPRTPLPHDRGVYGRRAECAIKAILTKQICGKFNILQQSSTVERGPAGMSARLPVLIRVDYCYRVECMILLCKGV